MFALEVQKRRPVTVFMFLWQKLKVLFIKNKLLCAIKPSKIGESMNAPQNMLEEHTNKCMWTAQYSLDKKKQSVHFLVWWSLVCLKFKSHSEILKNRKGKQRWFCLWVTRKSTWLAVVFSCTCLAMRMEYFILLRFEKKVKHLICFFCAFKIGYELEVSIETMLAKLVTVYFSY